MRRHSSADKAEVINGALAVASRAVFRSQTSSLGRTLGIVEQFKLSPATQSVLWQQEPLVPMTEY